MGAFDLDVLLDESPLTFLSEQALLTSLFGRSCAGTSEGEFNIGAPEPCERFINGESGPTLDLGLPLPFESCKVDNRLYQDPLDDNESLGSSDPDSWIDPDPRRRRIVMFDTLDCVTSAVNGRSVTGGTRPESK